MDFASYYLELFEMLNQACQKIASGHYDQKDSERLFELAKRQRYPSLLADLAESFGMMMVKVEAREFRRADHRPRGGGHDSERLRHSRPRRAQGNLL